jgi:hypothetical protein
LQGSTGAAALLTMSETPAMDPGPLENLARFLEDTTDAPEVLWLAAVAMLERATAEAREAKWSRFRYYPAGELRRLRRSLSEGVRLARLAVAIQEDENDRNRALDVELAEAAAEVGRARRRAQTLPAEQARLARAAARRAAREGSEEGVEDSSGDSDGAASNGD